MLSYSFSLIHSNSARFLRSNLLQDRSTIERMKWDILRRVEKMEEAEAELLEEEEDNSKRKMKLRSDTAYDEDEIAVGTSRIRPLGDEQSDADSSSGSGTESEPLDPETVIEQAYFYDPSVFGRDASTRRGKARVELRNLTGWADEQIEGWKIMLEKTVSFFFFLGGMQIHGVIAREEGEVGGKTRV